MKDTEARYLFTIAKKDHAKLKSHVAKIGITLREWINNAIKETLK